MAKKEDDSMTYLINKKGLEEYKKLLHYMQDIKIKLETSSPTEQFCIIEEMYKVVKEYSLLFFDEEKYSIYYKNILDLVIECESAINSFNLYGNIDNNMSTTSLSNINSIEELLDYIVYKVRKTIIKEYIMISSERFHAINPNINISQIDLTSMCDTISSYVSMECKKLGIKCKKVQIAPGFNERMHLYNNGGMHTFNIIEIGNKEYLMDLSYNQFFKEDSTNMLERLGIPYLSPCKPGIYMMTNHERFLTASTIIEKGWVPFNEQNIKNYFDGFTLSVRNGLYYELLGKVDYSTNYTSDDYINFLEGSDDLFKHEPNEGLGYQKRPLKNPYLNFNIKK